MIERVLRVTAIAMAVLAMLDPALSISARTRPRLSVIVQKSSSTVGDAIAEQVRAAIHRSLRDEFGITDGRDPSAQAAVVIGDRYPDEPLAETIPISTVTVPGDPAPNVRVAAIAAPRAVLPATAVPIRVTIEAAGVRGSNTTIRLRAGGAEIGRSAHTWAADRESWAADFDALPMGEPPYAFEVVADPLPAERASADNAVVAHVDRSAPARVFAFDARPSWASAFVRRAIERDSRFVVAGSTRASPRALVQTGRQAAWPIGLDTADVIIVGGMDRLSSSDVDLLDRFMRLRGGSLLLLPDTLRSSDAARALLAGVTLRQALLDGPAALESAAAIALRLDASELLEAETLPSRSTVIAKSASSTQPVVWTTPRGDGMFLFSGAMDAWRYRADRQVEFDRFWRSVVSGLALAARPPVDVTLSPSHASRGERVTVTARVRRLEREQLGESLWVSARTAGGTPIRMWPDARPGVFTGSFVADEPEASRSALVTATVGGTPLTTQRAAPQAAGSVRLYLDSVATPRNGAPLSMLSESHGGVDVGPADLERLERRVRTNVRGEPARAVRHPMRSAWWVVPFAACLSGEWWLRRRRGQR